MSAQENINIAQQAYANFASGDIGSLLGMLSEDVRWTLPEIENVPFAGARQGREAVGQFFASIAELQEAVEFTPQTFTAQDDRVVVQGRYRWRIKATGREYSADWVHVFTIRDGQVVSFQEYTDTALAAAAFRQAMNA
ncbi:MAG TPA: nuclear transport factor 2 family protein [Blastocatellia bacterium]|nr:nuclear transport factor 2 family protein [Blastocatellia bacterium]